MTPDKMTLDWEVETQKLYNKDGRALADYRLLTRSDNGSVLNVCKKTYRPTLNETFKDCVKRMQKITNFELSGFVEGHGGKKIFAYLKSENQSIAGFDFNNYMVIGNSHDYSSGFFIGTVHYMMRCQNQWATVKKGALHTVSHTANSDELIDRLMLRFEHYQTDLNENKKRLETWREIEIPQELREAMIARILAIELGKEGGVPTRTQNRIEALEYSIDRECGDIGDNLLGLFQGVTHYTTHVMAQKERVFGNIIGRSHEINKKAFEFCTQVENGSRPNLIFGNN
jgi:hypothetical protein